MNVQLELNESLIEAIPYSAVNICNREKDRIKQGIDH